MIVESGIAFPNLSFVSGVSEMNKYASSSGVCEARLNPVVVFPCPVSPTISVCRCGFGMCAPRMPLYGSFVDPNMSFSELNSSSA